jgi:MFS family permease
MGNKLTSWISPIGVISLSQWLVVMGWFNFSSILPSFQRDISLSSAQSGILMSMFQLGYLLSVIVMGNLADRMKPRLIFIASAKVAGTGGLLFAWLAEGFWRALIFRFIAGLGLGGIYVPGLKYLAGLYPSSQRGRVYGIYVGSLVVGSGSSLLTASPLSALFDWREIMAITSSTALLGAVIMLFYKVDPPLNRKLLRNTSKQLKILTGNKKLLQMNAAYMGHMWELYAFWGWVGPFLVFAYTRQGYDWMSAQSFANLWAGSIIIIGALGTVLGGKWSDHFGRAKTLKPLLWTSLICSLGFGWLSGSSLSLLIVIGLIYGITVVADSPIYSASISELSLDDAQGLALSLQQAIGYGITIITPALFGWILLSVSDETVAWGLAFTMLAVGPFLSLLFLRNWMAPFQTESRIDR